MNSQQTWPEIEETIANLIPKPDQNYYNNRKLQTNILVNTCKNSNKNLNNRVNI